MRPLGMGIFERTLMYELYTWFDGEDLYRALPRMNPEEQFEAGKKTGELLRKLHALPPMYDAEPWGIRFGRKVRDIIQSYDDKPDKSQSVDLLIQYLQDNQKLLDNRPHSFTHGDFDTSNIMLTPDGQIGIIDIGGGNNCNDPWWDFFWAVNGGDAHFNTGLIKGYFEGEPPIEYFRLLSYYIVLGTLEWCSENAKTVLNWFDDMRNPVPIWYLSHIE